MITKKKNCANWRRMTYSSDQKKKKHNIPHHFNTHSSLYGHEQEENWNTKKLFESIPELTFCLLDILHQSNRHEHDQIWEHSNYNHINQIILHHHLSLQWMSLQARPTHFVLKNPSCFRSEGSGRRDGYCCQQSVNPNNLSIKVMDRLETAFSALLTLEFFS